MAFRNPQALYLLLVVLLLGVAWLARRGRLAPGALLLRLLSATLIVVAIADPILVRGGAAGSTLVVLVDQSDSLGAAGKEQLRQQAERLATQTRSADGTTHVISFGATIANAGDAAQLQPDQTDIAGALRAAGGLIGAGGGRVVLLSDGAQTRGDALEEARQLQRRGIPVDTFGYAAQPAPEVWAERIGAPATLRVGQQYNVEIAVGSNVAGSAQLQLFDGETPVEVQNIDLKAGENSFSYTLTARQPGIARLRATIVAQPDGFSENNSVATTALVAPAPKILLLEGRSGDAGPLSTALRDADIETEVIPAASLPVELSRLDAYEGAVLVDVPAGELTTDQMATLREFVRSEGRGLVATGGRSSFTLGAYKDTPLEEVLPVSMTPPPRPERSDVTLLLIIDKSASMSVPETPSKFDMAKEAAILATDSLRENDRVGVLAFDTGQDWAVPFQQIGAGVTTAQIQEQIGRIPLGGGTDIYEALDLGISELERQPGKVRHAVLLTDGRSFTTTRGPYQALLERARSENITLSAIAIGDDADTELLQDLAQWGAGRYHFAPQPDDIPRLTLLESDIARTEPQVEGDFRAELAAPHPLLRDFQPNQIPGLQGYVATTIKPEAELVLQSPEDDPVLAVWQYGLGRAVAWTPSVEAPWADNWSSWPDYGQFWAEIIRYTLPEPDSGPLQVRADRHGDEVTITAESVAPSGAPLDLADTEATITLPDGSTQALPLRQTAPGRYAQTLALPAGGAYAIGVRQRKDTIDRSALAGYVQPYSAEYLPSDAGPALLRQISAASGGRALTNLAEVRAPGGAATGGEGPGLWLWLLLAALLLWPLEIALRRGWLRR